MSVWRVIAATFVIFVAGFIAGVIAAQQVQFRTQSTAAARPATLTEHVLWPKTPTNVPPAGTNAWKRLTTDFITHFGKELELSPEQSTKIESIITDGQKRTKAISDQLQPKIREEMKNTKELIRTELNPVQRKKFDAIYKGKPPAKKGDKKPSANGARPDHKPVGTATDGA